MESELCPAQKESFDWLVAAWEMSPILHLWTPDGYGRSKVLHALHKRFGGVRIGLKDFVSFSGNRHPLALEDALYDLVMKALSENDIVFVDDWHVAAAAPGGSCHFYPRTGYLDSPAGAIASYVQDSGKKLVVGTDGSLSQALRDRCVPYGIKPFQPIDYAGISANYASESAIDRVDFDKIHRFAPRLNGHQLKSAAIWVLSQENANTDIYVDYLRSQQLTSNVELGEVADVSFNELKGLYDIIQSLEANIILPFENDALSRQFDIKPKRGVLLAGPPGTGKTTVGRALAHRLKGKFFLIDGTIISGTRDFYGTVHKIFEYAKDNAPSVIFIDDSDVIFESGQEHGLYRYLLTMLDGLESKSVGRVCVILTAMDVGNLPPALVRSGRIELWLNMRYPDLDARIAILQQQSDRLPEPFNTLDVGRVAAATEGLSGADLKRIVEEGKILYAYDLAVKGKTNAVTEYLITAVDNVIQSRDMYSAAETRANANRNRDRLGLTPTCTCPARARSRKAEFRKRISLFAGVATLQKSILPSSQNHVAIR